MEEEGCLDCCGWEAFALEVRREWNELKGHKARMRTNGRGRRVWELRGDRCWVSGDRSKDCRRWHDEHRERDNGLIGSVCLLCGPPKKWDVSRLVWRVDESTNVSLSRLKQASVVASPLVVLVKLWSVSGLELCRGTDWYDWWRCCGRDNNEWCRVWLTLTFIGLEIVGDAVLRGSMRGSTKVEGTDLVRGVSLGVEWYLTRVWWEADWWEEGCWGEERHCDKLARQREETEMGMLSRLNGFELNLNKCDEEVRSNSDNVWMNDAYGV